MCLKIATFTYYWLTFTFKIAINVLWFRYEAIFPPLLGAAFYETLLWFLLDGGNKWPMSSYSLEDLLEMTVSLFPWDCFFPHTPGKCFFFSQYGGSFTTNLRLFDSLWAVNVYTGEPARPFFPADHVATGSAARPKLQKFRGAWPCAATTCRAFALDGKEVSACLALGIPRRP